MPNSTNLKSGATAFAVWAYLGVLVFMVLFVVQSAPGAPSGWLFGAAVAGSYALLYALPTIGAAWLAGRLAERGRLWRLGLPVLAVGLLAVTQFWLFADYTIHGMFGYHINGFVINLVMTPEGIESMGADTGTAFVYAGIVLGLLALNTAAWFCLGKTGSGSRVSNFLARRRWRYAVIGLVAAGLGERVAHGVAHVRARSDIMTVAAAIPGYQPMTFRSWAKRFGIEMERRVDVDAPRADAKLTYPLKPLEFTAPQQPLNIVWLACESLRADMLTPEIMPRTWALAQEGQRFTRHYSGGNGTRMGMFTMFYGMPGSYWFKVLQNRRPPVLVDRVQELGYDLRLSTSAAFSYPEFDKTIFAHVPAAQMYAYAKGAGWERDRHNVGLIKTWLTDHEEKKPFFLFHFFESPHARYEFPPESVIRRPYLESFNYATADIDEDIGLILNRYINSVHHLDSQIGEVIDALRAKGVLDRTLVVITGDHGEEFMETGRWGHNSNFSETQVRVPLVMRIPGRAPAVIEHPTSHTDLVPTVLPMLGVKNPAADYSTGQELFDGAPRLLTFADWDRIAISDGRYKATFPLAASGQISSQVMRADDKAVADKKAAMAEMGGSMARLMMMMSRFSAKK